MQVSRQTIRGRIAALLGVLLTAVSLIVAVPAPAQAAAANPVLVVAGILEPVHMVDTLANRLRGDGFTVRTMELPGLGHGDIALSAPAVRDAVSALRAETGAAKVDIVAHSEGGLASRYYIKFLGGDTQVGRLVMLATPNYGAVVGNMGICIPTFSAACWQMSMGSDFLNNLNAGDDTPGAVKYTSLATLYDEFVRPTSNAFLQDGATNAYVQSYCPLRVVYHIEMIYEHFVENLVRSALRDQPLSANCWLI
ncbi:lipase family alpha/beta hydrolase [Streptomyces gardneri]|uniref:lipase family alpha/beta hydrolase n=1 Tax=Streptomyces gardneri TaxID=66892 RepID=UPI0036AB5217